MAALATSPTPDDSIEDIPPLAFDTEQELLDVLARLRHDLLRRVQSACTEPSAANNKSKGKGRASTTQQTLAQDEVEYLVMTVSNVLLLFDFPTTWHGAIELVE